jgi:ribosome assembly protein 1
LWAKKLGVQRATLRKTLWGDFYYHVKTKKIYKKPIGKSPPMFVQFVLNNIWEVYNAVTPNRDLDKLGKIAKALGLQVSNREFNHDDTGTVIQSFMGRWLPISSAVLDVVVEQLPNPRDAQKIRIPHLWKPIPVPGHEDEITKFTNSLSLCDAAPSAPVIGFVSKVFSVPNDQLMLDMRVSGGVVMPKPRRKPGEEGAAPSTPAPAAPAPVQSQLERGGQSFIAMARLFSGELKVGDTLNIMGVRYNPALSTEKHRIEVQVPQLFLLMGRSLQPIKQVTAGQVFGIGGDAVVSQIVKVR